MNIFPVVYHADKVSLLHLSSYVKYAELKSCPCLSVARSQSAGPGGRSPRKGTRQSMLAKERDVDAHTKPLQRHPRPSEISLDLIFDTPSKSLPKQGSLWKHSSLLKVFHSYLSN